MNTLPGRLVLLGHPLGHTLSPRIHNAALTAAGIDLKYEALDLPPSAMDDTLEALRRIRAAGNVTIPYKEAVRDACDRLTHTATAVGAVNTFWTAVDGALVGDNTDVGGFESAVRKLLGGAPRHAHVALLGAGGGAAAVLRAMEGWDDARVRLYARTGARAERLLDRFTVVGEVTRSVDAALDGATLLVNATPVGLRDESLPAPIEHIPRDCAVIDLAYRVGETTLVRSARAAGHRAMDGLHMLIEQAALAFEAWFGVSPDRSAMWTAVGETR
jgi:shikimate dehydrogenase